MAGFGRYGKVRDPLRNRQFHAGLVRDVIARAGNFSVKVFREFDSFSQRSGPSSIRHGIRNTIRPGLG